MNGAGIGIKMIIMQRARPEILQVLPRARSGSFAAARGAAAPGTAGRLSASASSPSGGAAASASVLSCFQVSEGEPVEERSAESSAAVVRRTEAGVECCISMELRSVPDLLLFLIVKFLRDSYLRFREVFCEINRHS